MKSERVLCVTVYIHIQSYFTIYEYANSSSLALALGDEIRTCSICYGLCKYVHEVTFIFDETCLFTNSSRDLTRFCRKDERSERVLYVIVHVYTQSCLMICFNTHSSRIASAQEMRLERVLFAMTHIHTVKFDNICIYK